MNVNRALAVYAAHRWNASTRLCACGEFFEATLKSVERHKAHRMEAALKAGGESPALSGDVVRHDFPGGYLVTVVEDISYPQGGLKPPVYSLKLPSNVKDDELLLWGHEIVWVKPEDIFCDLCAGPYEALMEQYGGHWDTCPNRAKALPPKD